MKESKVMMDLPEIKRDILAIGKVEGRELEVLRRRVYAGGTVNRPESPIVQAVRRQKLQGQLVDFLNPMGR
jgi:hypothetical protein